MRDEKKSVKYGVLAIIILLVAALASMRGAETGTGTGEEVIITAAMVYEKGEKDCRFLPERPCYMRGAKAPHYWTQVGETGAKLSYEKCLQNPALTGEALFWTEICKDNWREKVRFCYPGHGFALYYLNGECVPA